MNITEDPEAAAALPRYFLYRVAQSDTRKHSSSPSLLLSAKKHPTPPPNVRDQVMLRGASLGQLGKRASTASTSSTSSSLAPIHMLAKIETELPAQRRERYLHADDVYVGTQSASGKTEWDRREIACTREGNVALFYARNDSAGKHGKFRERVSRLLRRSKSSSVDARSSQQGTSTSRHVPLGRRPSSSTTGASSHACILALHITDVDINVIAATRMPGIIGSLSVLLQSVFRSTLLLYFADETTRDMWESYLTEGDAANSLTQWPTERPGSGVQVAAAAEPKRELPPTVTSRAPKPVVSTKMNEYARQRVPTPIPKLYTSAPVECRCGASEDYSEISAAAQLAAVRQARSLIEARGRAATTALTPKFQFIEKGCQSSAAISEVSETSSVDLAIANAALACRSSRCFVDEKPASTHSSPAVSRQSSLRSVHAPASRHGSRLSRKGGSQRGLGHTGSLRSVGSFHRTRNGNPTVRQDCATKLVSTTTLLNSAADGIEGAFSNLLRLPSNTSFEV